MLPIENLYNTKPYYLPTLSRKMRWLYWILCLSIVGTIVALPYIHTDISIKATGITRPKAERTEIKAIISGVVDSLYFHEGDYIPKNAVLLRLRDPLTPEKVLLHNYQISQREQFVHDLKILTSKPFPRDPTQSHLQSPLYREQVAHYIHLRSEQEAMLKKANKEVEMNASLARDRVISPKEFFDIENSQEKIQEGFMAFQREQITNWQQDLVKYQLELSQYSTGTERDVWIFCGNYFPAAPRRSYG